MQTIDKCAASSQRPRTAGKGHGKRTGKPPFGYLRDALEGFSTHPTRRVANLLPDRRVWPAGPHFVLAPFRDSAANTTAGIAGTGSNVEHAEAAEIRA